MNVVLYILKNTAFKQKDIAAHLGVSQAQVSKWKSGEPLPESRQQQLYSLAGLTYDDGYWCGLVDDGVAAARWIDIITEISEFSDNGASRKVSDEPNMFIPQILRMFVGLGMTLPTTLPEPDDFGSMDPEEMDDFGTDEVDDHFAGFRDVLYDFFSNYAALERWCDIHMMFNDSDLFDLAFDVQCMLPELALMWTEDHFISNAGGDPKLLHEVVAKTKDAVHVRLHQLCGIQVEKGQAILQDYFKILSDHPNQLDDEMMTRDIVSLGILDYISYAERALLNEARLSREILVELHVKVDALLPSEAKDLFSKKLAHCPPSSSKR